jgi:hypothetical protein
VEPQAVVTLRPVVSGLSITLSHYAVDAHGLETCRQRNGTIGALVLVRIRVTLAFTYAFPLPMIKTSVSACPSPSSSRPGERSNASSSGCMSRLSSHVLRIQIFQWTPDSLLPMGKRIILPWQVAAGELVLKARPQSMHC